MKAFLIATAVLVSGLVAQASEVQFLSFKGKAALEQVKLGSVKETVRLGDRSAPPSSFKVGIVVPLVNSDQAEDSRKPEDQIATNAYGKVELVSLKVSKFEALSKKDQDEFLKFYTPEKLAEAKGIVTIIGLKFK